MNLVRGNHQASHDYHAVLKDYGMTPSRSGKATARSTPEWKLLQQPENELVHHARYQTRGNVRQDISITLRDFITRDAVAPLWDMSIRQSIMPVGLPS
jgi:hypothetical protein